MSAPCVLRRTKACPLPGPQRTTTLVGNLILWLLCGCGTENLPEPDTNDAGIEIASPGASEQQLEKRSTRLQFVDRAADSGIIFTVRNGEEAGQFAIVESLGAGVSLIDVDADGRLDVIIPGGGEFVEDVPIGLPFALFRQLDTWKFEESSTLAGLPVPESFSHGIAVADFDADGFSDVLVTGFREIILLQNQGDGTFSDVTSGSGLASTGWSTGSAWADFTSDGILDLYVVNYVNWSPDNNPECRFGGRRDVCSPKHFEAESDTLWIGSGDGSYRKATEGTGLQPGGKGLSVLAADVDMDRDVDIYVANDTTPNFLYRNDGPEELSEIGLASGTALGDPAEADGSMGVDLGDFNSDGLLDLWVANYEQQAFALYRNEGSNLFQHVSSISGVTSVGRSFVGFGTVARDFDLDGDLDIAVTNGHVMQNSVNSPVRQRPLLFENDGQAGFQNVASEAGDYFRTDHIGRGMAAGDLDGDGDSDLVVSHSNSPVAVLENTGSGSTERLRLRLIGTDGNRDAIGTTVTITGDGEPRRYQITSGGSYLAESDRTLIVAGGTSPDQVRIRVDWLDGTSFESDVRLRNGSVTCIKGNNAFKFVEQ